MKFHNMNEYYNITEVAKFCNRNTKTIRAYLTKSDELRVVNEYTDIPEALIIEGKRYWNEDQVSKIKEIIDNNKRNPRKQEFDYATENSYNLLRKRYTKLENKYNILQKTIEEKTNENNKQ